MKLEKLVKRHEQKLDHFQTLKFRSDFPPEIDYYQRKINKLQFQIEIEKKTLEKLNSKPKKNYFVNSMAKQYISETEDCINMAIIYLRRNNKEFAEKELLKAECKITRAFRFI